MNTSNPTPVLVLDGHLKQSLAIVRSLGGKGISVTVGASRKTAFSLHSRYAQDSFVYPSPLEDQAGFLTVLFEQLELMQGTPVVYASSDATFRTIYQHLDQFAGKILFPLPSNEAIDIAFDKAATYSEAKILGLSTIDTYLREQAVEFDKLQGTLQFPLVVKPRGSAAWGSKGGFAGTAQFVHSLDQLKVVFSELKELTGSAPLVQPLIEGEEYGVELLAHAGKIVAHTVHHRIRSMSPTGGASVVKETCVVEGVTEAMLDTATRLVEALGWEGPLMVEFKVDGDSREPLLMELNGRWWGSLPLAIAAGVDFPYMYYRLATHGVVSEKVVSATSGIITKHWLGDVRHLLRVWLARDPMRSRLYPRRMKALKDFFTNPRSTVSDVWNWRDPLPSVMEYVDVVYKLWK